MKLNLSGKFLLMIAVVLAVGLSAFVAMSQHLDSQQSVNQDANKAVLKRLEEIQAAAESLDPDKVFSFVLENDSGALIQNGKLFLTRSEALDATKQGFQNLKKVEYHFNQQHVTLLSPTIALAVGEGTSSITTEDDRSFNRQFAQTVVLLLTNGEWKVLHAHRSFPP